MATSVETENSILGLMILNQDVLTTDLFTDTEGIYYSKIFEKPSNHVWYQLKWVDSQDVSTAGKTNIDVRLRTGDQLPYVSQITKKPYTLDAFNTLVKASNPNQIDEVLYKWEISRSTLGSSAAGYPTYSQGQSRIQVTTSADTTLLKEMGTATNTSRLSRNNRFTEQLTITDSAPYVINLAANVVPQSVFIYGFQLSSVDEPSENQYQVSSSDSAVTITFNAANSGQQVYVKYIVENDQVWNYWSLPFLHTPAYVSNNVSHNFIQFRIDLRSLDHVSKIEMYKMTISSLLKKDADS